MMTVNEVSKLSGVSVRTLHYYDEIGLLQPAAITGAGYRLYGDAELERLQDIMLFRELEFPLKDIRRIIDNPDFDRQKALEEQIHLLQLRRNHLTQLIRFANGLKKKGEHKMTFKAFDKSKLEAYEKLAKESWGETDAYKEFEKKNAGKDERVMQRDAEGLMDIFYEFGDMKDKDVKDPAVKAQVKKLQQYITEHYYTCTDRILLGLGQMYTAGGEMTANIDAAGGKGCAAFVQKAIESSIPKS